MQLAVWLIERPRWFKRTLLIVNDLVMLTVALWAAYSLRLSHLYIPDTLPKVLLMAAAPLIGVRRRDLRPRRPSWPEPTCGWRPGSCG